MDRRQQRHGEAEIGDGGIGDGQDGAGQQQAVSLARGGTLVAATLVQRQAEDAGGEPAHAQGEGERAALQEGIERERCPETAGGEQEACIDGEDGAPSCFRTARLANRLGRLPRGKHWGEATHYKTRFPARILIGVSLPPKT